MKSIYAKRVIAENLNLKDKQFSIKMVRFNTILLKPHVFFFFLLQTACYIQNKIKDVHFTWGINKF